jgi:Protein of unknown function (DUF3667)/Domain of unknown function (DUF4286)
MSTATHVIYEVEVELDPRIVGEYDTWLELHMREVLACEGFETGRVFVPEDKLADDGWVRRTVHYHVASRELLQRYFDGPATVLRQQALERFGTKFRATRRVFAPRSELATPAGESHGTTATECANCSTPVTGEFCGHCGQENKVYLRGFHKVLADFLGDLLNFDSRFFGSLWPLFVRPGLLTKEYLAGRRVRFIPPVRMYLFSSLLFFGMVAFFVSSGNLDFNIDEDAQAEAAADVAKEPAAPAGPQGTIGGQGFGVSVNGDKSDVSFTDAESGLLKDAEDRARHNVEKFRKDKDFRQLLIERGVGNLPLMMFLLLPFYALLLKLLYIRSGRYYVEHIIYALHIHSFMFVTLGGVLGWFLTAPWFGYQAAPPDLLVIAFWGWILLYAWFAMKRMYGQGWWKTTFKYLFLGFSYIFLLAFALIGAIFLTLST